MPTPDRLTSAIDRSLQISDPSNDETVTGVMVAIPTLARPNLLRRSLESLRVQLTASVRWRILVIDNDEAGSGLQVFDEVAEDFPVPLSYAREMRRGFASVRNRALAERRSGEAVAFLDDDMVASPNWIATVARLTRENPRTLIRTPCLRVPPIPEEHDLASQFEGLDVSKAIPVGTGGLAIPPCIARVGQFDTYFDRSGGEDTDYILRLSEMGFESVVASETVCIEEDRLRHAALIDLAKRGFSGGRIFVMVQQRHDRSTIKFRVRAGLLLLADTLHLALLLLTGRRPSTRLRVEVMARRLAVATAPRRRANPKLGERH